MKAWLANLLWDVVCIVSVKLHDWVFDPQRHARIRFAHRERWWAYKCKAEKTKNPRDDRRARCWEVEFGFETPPVEAMRRGDLDIEARKMAMDAVDEVRAKFSGPHQP